MLCALNLPKITFKPQAPGGAPRDVWMVVETEESRWTYHITGNVM
jgi:hypothetical protein